jgi:glycosyltransferase involved in cell wall biosynthesis
VIFEGAVNADRVRELYRGADIFALASFAEGIPIVLMEAMAMQIPAVATRITGIPELIRDGIDGFLVMPSDVDELASAISRLAGDEQLRRDLGRAGRARVLDKYNLPRNIERLAGIFRARLPSEFAAQPAGEDGPS